MLSFVWDVDLDVVVGVVVVDCWWDDVVLDGEYGGDCFDGICGI